MNSHDPTCGGAQARGRRILVVDDDVDSAASLALLLRTRGNEISMAHDGLAAVSAVEAFRPHVVLLDLSLPGLDGIETGRRIRELPAGKNVLLIALTGWSREDARQRSRAAGFDDHLVKPVDFPVLMKRLEV
jgi:DNA-binding response OmpR family regulator